MTSIYVHEQGRFELFVGRQSNGYIDWIIIQKNGLLYRGEVNLYHGEKIGIVESFLEKIPDFLQDWLQNHPSFYQPMFILASSRIST